MCLDPITMTALTVAGTLASTAGALQQGRAAQAQGNYEKAVADRNAQQERMRGAAEADRIEDRYDKLRGQQAAQAAAAGINPGSGSASLVINQDTGKNEALDTMAALWNADSAASSFEHSGRAAQMRGNNAKTASYWNAASSFMSGLGSASSQYRQATRIA